MTTQYHLVTELFVRDMFSNRRKKLVVTTYADTMADCTQLHLNKLIEAHNGYRGT